jgi:protein-tyrosine-phosphatase
MPETCNVQYLCSGNSVGSIIEESLLNHWGKEKFRGYSAGSFLKDDLNPFSIELLKSLKPPAQSLRSNS